MWNRMTTARNAFISAFTPSRAFTHTCDDTKNLRRTIYQVRQKVNNSWKSFAVFSATAWNFCVKFYQNFYVTVPIAEWHLNTTTLLIFWRYSDFRALKNVCTETQQNSVTETTQRTVFVWCLTVRYFMFSYCSPSAFVHVFSHSVELLTNYWLVS